MNNGTLEKPDYFPRNILGNPSKGPLIKFLILLVARRNLLELPKKRL
jgi:hypothetical protein